MDRDRPAPARMETLGRLPRWTVVALAAVPIAFVAAAATLAFHH